MNVAFQLSADSRRTAGVILLTIVAIEWGGWYLLRILRGKVERTSLQQSFERAGHAHAGVLVTLALVCLILADSTRLDGTLAFFARQGVAGAAILVPAGFFFSVIGRGVTKPNGFVVLIYLGMLSLAAGVVSLGVGLLSA
nr:hypothetical protein [Kibdelosporangium sp. MJ126-NF4]